MVIIYKANVYPTTGHEGPEGKQRYTSTVSLTSALGADGWSTPRHGRFSPGKNSVPIEYEAGWAPGPVCTDAGYLASHRNLIPGPSYT
jgi:hypothetical protein